MDPLSLAFWVLNFTQTKSVSEQILIKTPKFQNINKTYQTRTQYRINIQIFKDSNKYLKISIYYINN